MGLKRCGSHSIGRKPANWRPRSPLHQIHHPWQPCCAYWFERQSDCSRAKRAPVRRHAQGGVRGKAERKLCIATVLTADFRQLGIKA